MVVMGRKQRAKPQRGKATRLFYSLLTDGPKLASEARAWLEANGISDSSIARGRRDAGVTTLGDDGSGSQAVWTLDPTQNCFPRRATGSSYRPRIPTLATDRIGYDCMRFASPPKSESQRPSWEDMRLAFENALPRTRYRDQRWWRSVEEREHPHTVTCNVLGWQEPAGDDSDEVQIEGGIDTTIGGMRIEFGCPYKKRELFQVFLYAAPQVLLDLDEVDAILAIVQRVALPWFPGIDPARFFHAIFAEPAYDAPLPSVTEHEILQHIHKPGRPMQLHWSPFYVRDGSRDEDFDIAYHKVEDSLAWWRFETKKLDRTLKQLDIHHARDLRGHLSALFDMSLPPALQKRAKARIQEYDRGESVRQLTWSVPSVVVPALTNLNRYLPGWDAKGEKMRTSIIEAMTEAERIRMTTSGAPQPAIMKAADRAQHLVPSSTLAQVYANNDPSSLAASNTRGVWAHFAAVLPALYLAFRGRDGYDDWPAIVAVFDAAVQAGNTWAQATRDATKARLRLQEYQQLVAAALRMTTPAAVTPALPTHRPASNLSCSPRPVAAASSTAAVASTVSASSC